MSLVCTLTVTAALGPGGGFFYHVLLRVVDVVRRVSPLAFSDRVAYCCTLLPCHYCGVSFGRGSFVFSVMRCCGWLEQPR